MPRKTHVKCKFRLSKRKLKKLKAKPKEYVPKQGRSERAEVKHRLINKYGCYCWLCGQEFSKKRLTIHHIIKFEFTKHTVEEESCILCEDCHFNKVNKVEYMSKEYKYLMAIIEQFR